MPVRLIPTPQQAKVAAFIKEYQRRNQTPPSHKEIADAFGFKSTNSVRSHLRLMEKKGMIFRDLGKARGLRLSVRKARRSKQHRVEDGIPIIGSIPAGIPFSALQEQAERLPIAAGLFFGAELFALKIEGQSMRDAGIFDGDIAILNRQADISDGQIAAVIIESAATLKRFYRKGDSVILRAANPVFDDIVITGSDDQRVAIAGRLVGVLRTNGSAPA